jgi:hypothetical protein
MEAKSFSPIDFPGWSKNGTLEFFATLVLVPDDNPDAFDCTELAAVAAISLTVVSVDDVLDDDPPQPASARQISIALLSVTPAAKKPVEPLTFLISIPPLNSAAETVYHCLP